MAAPSFDSGGAPPPGSFYVGENYASGSRVFVTSLDNLSIAAGEEIDVPIVVNMKKFTKYYVYYNINQDILLTVDWFNSPERGYIREKVVALSASSPDGTFLEGRVQAEKLQIRFTNNAIPNPPSSDITDIYIAVFAVQ